MYLPVSLKKIAALQSYFKQLGICEEAIEEQFVHAGGPGGQNVNKVATCVVLTHRPSGISVRCQEERSQGLNRYRARMRLAEKIDDLQQGHKARRQQEIEKVRRQKRKRSKRAKEKMLADKRRRSVTKQARKSVTGKKYIEDLL